MHAEGLRHAAIGIYAGSRLNSSLFPWKVSVGVVELFSVLATGLFAGAALYVNLVEHPARLELGTAFAVTQFGPSYRRAAIMMVALALLGCVTAVIAWWGSSDVWWLVGGVLIVAVLPFTRMAILPTNKQLLDPTLDKHSSHALQLIETWGRLHTVRTVLGLTAFIILLAALIRS